MVLRKYYKKLVLVYKGNRWDTYDELEMGIRFVGVNYFQYL